MSMKPWKFGRYDRPSSFDGWPIIDGAANSLDLGLCAYLVASVVGLGLTVGLAILATNLLANNVMISAKD